MYMLLRGAPAKASTAFRVAETERLTSINLS